MVIVYAGLTSDISFNCDELNRSQPCAVGPWCPTTTDVCIQSVSDPKSGQISSCKTYSDARNMALDKSYKIYRLHYSEFNPVF